MKTTKRKCKVTSIKQTKCQICKKVVTGSSYKYRSHLYQHNVVKPRFECLHCSKHYFRRDSFIKHVAVHKNYDNLPKKKFYICDHCDRSFVDKRNLVNHLRIHDEYFNKSQGQYKCMACGLCYCEERLLKYHIRKQHFNLTENISSYDKKEVNETWVEHVKQSEVCVEITKIDKNTIVIKKCPTPVKNECAIETYSKPNFKAYMNSVFAMTDKSHYSKAVCDYCNKGMLKKSLISHIRERHLKLKRFKCEVCNVSFSRHYQLVDHKCGKFNTRKRK